MLRRLLPLCAFLPAAGCFDPADVGIDESYVIGGSPSSAGEFPGVGALIYDFGGQSMIGCTGTLIAPNAVLTAAHCVDPDTTGGIIPGFTLALDTNNPGGLGTVAGAATYKHESFTFEVELMDGLDQFFDIGIVILGQPITTVEPVKLPRPDQVPALVAGLDLEIAGYGRTSTQTDDVGVLYDARTKLVSLNATEIQVGMGSPQPQNCNGDSGGPGLADLGDGRRVVGVVSRSFSGPECIRGGIDTRVDAYLPWIHGKVPTGIPCGSGMSPACEEENEDDGGCCSTGRGAGRGTGGAVLALLVGLAVVGRPRRRRR